MSSKKLFLSGLTALALVGCTKEASMVGLLQDVQTPSAQAAQQSQPQSLIILPQDQSLISLEPDQQPVSIDSETGIVQPVTDSAQAVKVPEPGSIVGLAVLAGIAIAAGQKQD